MSATTDRQPLDLDAAERHHHCANHVPGHAPDPSCMVCCLIGEVRALRAERDRLRDGIRDVLQHREGDLPTLGYLRDSQRAREALASLAALLDGNGDGEGGGL